MSGGMWFDEPVLRWFIRHREPWLTSIVRGLTILGSSAFLIPLVVFIGVWFRRRQRSSRPLLRLGTAYGGAYLLSQSLKEIAGRARPPTGVALGRFPGYAFPSGHATQAASVYGMLAAVVAATTPRWSRKLALWAGAMAITAVIGITRLYLGAHWLSDVLGGWAIGGSWLLLLLAVSRYRRPSSGSPR